jgi:hypothetical protein
MIRLGTVVWLALVALVGFGMFEVKYTVMDLEDELARTNKSIQLDVDAIHVLKAEWSYLDQPARLAELSHHFLDLAPLNTAQLGQIENIPMRPEAAPPMAAATTTLPAATVGRAATPATPAAATSPATAPRSTPPAKAPLAGMTAMANAKPRTVP